MLRGKLLWRPTTNYQRLTERIPCRLLGSSATLLTLLSNPRNVLLLTRQILSAPAVWQRPEGLQTPFRVLGAFNSASIHVLNRDIQQTKADYQFGPEPFTKDEWVKTVVQAADDRSPRWKHLLVLGGLLVGFAGQDRGGLSPDLRRLLEGAVVTAANLALEDALEQHELALHTVCLVLGHTFNLLSDFEKSRIDHNRLLPVITNAVYFSRDGLQWGYFLGTMDADVVQENSKFSWSAKSTTYYQVQRVSSAPLVAVLGSLSRLTAFCAESVTDVDLFFKLVEDISTFTRSLCVSWRQNKLSELDVSEEELYLHEQTIKNTLPLLWQLLKNTLFSIIIAESALTGRMIGDARIPRDQGPYVATQTLNTLRNLYFISARLGANSFSQQIFVYTASIDILSRYPVQAEAFLQGIKSTESDKIPNHPHARCMDLFYLNTAEYFAIALPPLANEQLLIAAAAPYVGTKNDPRLVELFEAAHSVMLAVFSNPRNHELTAQHLPLYVDTLFKVFPYTLSSRQFRLAIKTLVRVTSPPYAISESQPHFPSTLLEIVRARSEAASQDILPSLPHQPNSMPDPALSEQAVLVLALIDSLTVLPFYIMEEWLPLAADAMNKIGNHQLLERCRQRFWEVLSNGEMDVARAETCLAWWSTRNGRSSVLEGVSVTQGPFMSGALPMADSKL
jgi:hypothetical protein